MERNAKITIRKPHAIQNVRISSGSKPEIIPSLVTKWQSLIDTIADIIHVPSTLIMKLNEDTIEVFLKSNTRGNPYHAGEQAKLEYGLYCETVIGTQQKLLVPNAAKDPVWKENNPDVDINMVSYLGYPINWPDGEVFGTICVLDNKENHYNALYEKLLHHLKQHIETDLQFLSDKQVYSELNKQLNDSNAIKTRFLSLISHDLRGTIGTNYEFLKILIESCDDLEKDEIKTILESMLANTGSVLSTMESLLNWSKNDLLMLKPEKTKLNLVEVFDQLLDFFRQKINLKKINIIKAFYSEEAIVYADRNMIETSLRNILSNAIKYTRQEGTIYLRIARNQKRVLIEIEDTGIGMNKEELKHIFTSEQAYKRAGTDGEKSTGIGLFITKEFLDINGADVEVSSKPGKGTKFRIIL
jgi:c-di-GMP phosphodiesterase